MKQEISHSLRAPCNEDEWRAYHDIRRRVLFEIRGAIGVYDEQHPDEHRAGNYPLVLFRDAVPVGVIRVDVREKVAWLRRVAVREDCQRSGHGRVLLKLSEAFAGDLGCEEVVSNVNAEAVGFYERCGYVRDESRIVSTESIPMRKSLI